MNLKLVLRGLWRHKLRSFITIFSVVAGHAFGLVFVAFNGGGHELMVEIGVKQGSAGHIVIQEKGYQDEKAIELLVHDSDAIKKRISNVLPHAEYTARAFGNGLARSSSASVGVMMMGIEKSEKGLSTISENLKSGIYIGDTLKKKADDKNWCLEKHQLEKINPIVIGAQLAKTLKLDLCSKLVIDAQGLGSRESMQFRVTGIFKTGSTDIDAFIAQLRLQDLQKLLTIEKGVHQVAIFLPSAKKVPSALKKLKKELDSQSHEILPWDKAMPEMAEFIWLDETSGWITLIILYLIIAIGIINTMLMSVMERTRELGIMRALGSRPSRIVLLIFSEGLIIGFIGIILGSLFAWPILHHYNTVGLDMRQFTEGGAIEAGGVAFSIIKTKISLVEVGQAALAVLAMCLVATIYPAIRAAKLSILKAIYRH